MYFIGSKTLIWKQFLKDFVLNGYGTKYINYVEPFCGGCNSLCNVKQIQHGKRIASDINPYLIAMWKSLLNNENKYFPITKDIYQDAYKSYKSNDGRNSLSDLGWIGFIASYRAKFWGGYSSIYHCKRDGERDFIKSSLKSLFKTLEGLQGVQFHCCSYDELVIPERSIIYCDPPYKDTLGYGNSFNYDKFYNWCEFQRKRGNAIYVSEYSITDMRFVEIGRIASKCGLNKNQNQKDRIEKLYTIP